MCTDALFRPHPCIKVSPRTVIAPVTAVSSSSLMSGLAALDAKCSSRLGLITVSYYLWTTFVAVIVGIIMVSIIHPGGAAQKEDSEDSGKPIMSSADALLDLIRYDHHYIHVNKIRSNSFLPGSCTARQRSAAVCVLQQCTVTLKTNQFTWLPGSRDTRQHED